MCSHFPFAWCGGDAVVVQQSLPIAMPSTWLPSALLSYAVLFSTVHGQNGIDSTNQTSSLAPADCHCGFLDPLTGRQYTDSLITYFNETGSLPTDLYNVSSYAHPYEKGWQTFYRQGAVESNVYYQNGSVWNLEPGWLNMNVSAYTPEHLVKGSEIETKRQDMMYGTYRMLARSPAPYAGGGTAFAMRLIHNESFSAELDLLNMDDSGNAARYATTTNGMDPDPNNCLNYTTLEGDGYQMGTWDFWEYRIDWSEESIDWYAGVNKTRSLPASNWTLPMSFSVKHWSSGDENWMQGPPTNDTGAALGWLRMFFNSSLANLNTMPADCNANMLCSTEDETLRTNTPWTVEAVTPSEELVHKKGHHMSIAAIALAIVSVVLTAALFGFGLSKKALTRKQQNPARPTMKAHQSDLELSRIPVGSQAGNSVVGGAPAAARGQLDKHRSVSERPLLGPRDSYAASSIGYSPSTNGGNSGWTTPTRQSVYSTVVDPVSGLPYGAPPIPETPVEARYSGIGIATAGPAPSHYLEQGVSPAGDAVATESQAGLAGAVPGAHDAVKRPEAAPAPASKQAAGAAPVQRTRVDYLAGLVAMCSLLVSCTHFILTFVPSVIMEYLPQHYNSEYWARRTIEPFFFNEIWVGLFFTTSTRFLTTGYLRKGDLKIIAEKTVCRTPRLMIPIGAVILFEYFLMDLGATKYLEYIPSITWSTWPSTVVYTNFGWFLDETLQLIYLIPNAAPQLTYNFCTGVLWTIPVQLQNTWTVLLGVVIIKEIKTPWKRFGYYTFCIINHWYAMSWGSYFWFGLMLADLDINYKYRQTIQGRATLLYPLIVLASILVFVSLGNDLLSVWTGWTFSTNERSIHPDPLSGLSLEQAGLASYPEYTEPKLNGLVFCVASQFIVEISVWAQKFLSTKPFLLLFPHVFTIYLIHGLVFWSIGSLVCVYFAGQEMAYWLNMLLTALICYVTLFAALPIVTPIMELLGKEMTKSVWLSASEEPVEWKPTSWPFEKEEVQPKGVLEDTAP